MTVRPHSRSAARVRSVVLLMTLVVTACAPGPGTKIPVPGFTAPGPTLSIGLPALNVSFLGCSGTFTPPSAGVAGPTIVVPDFEYTVGAGTQTIPGIRILSTSATASVGSFRLRCPLPWPLPGVDVSSGASATIATGATTAVGTLDETARTITLTGLRLTVTASVRFDNFAGLGVPITPFSIPLPPVTLSI